MNNYPFVFIVDRNYFYVFLVSLISLKLQGYKNLFVVLDSKEMQEKLESINKVLNLNCKSIVYDVNNLIDENKQKATSNHVTSFAYVSCKVPELFSSYKYVMLLPVDSVLDTLSKLMIYEQFNQPIAAVPDLESTQIRVKGVADNSYFNAGVLIFNIGKWNELKLNDAMTILLQNGKTYEFHDQDVLNQVINGSYYVLPSYLNKIPEDMNNDQGELIHFAGSSKPWMSDSIRIGTERWRSNCSKSISIIENVKLGMRFRVEFPSHYRIMNFLKMVFRLFLPKQYRAETKALIAELEDVLFNLRVLTK